MPAATYSSNANTAINHCPSDCCMTVGPPEASPFFTCLELVSWALVVLEEYWQQWRTTMTITNIRWPHCFDLLYFISFNFKSYCILYYRNKQVGLFECRSVLAWHGLPWCWASERLRLHRGAPRHAHLGPHPNLAPKNQRDRFPTYRVGTQTQTHWHDSLQLATTNSKKPFTNMKLPDLFIWQPQREWDTDTVSIIIPWNVLSVPKTVVNWLYRLFLGNTRWAQFDPWNVCLRIQFLRLWQQHQDSLSRNVPCGRYDPASLYAATKRSDELIAHIDSTYFNLYNIIWAASDSDLLPSMARYGRPDMFFVVDSRLKGFVVVVVVVDLREQQQRQQQNLFRSYLWWFARPDVFKMILGN